MDEEKVTQTAMEPAQQPKPKARGGQRTQGKPLQARGEAGWPNPMPAIAILRTAKRVRKNKKVNPKIQNPRKNQKRGRNKPSRPKLPPRNR